MPKLRMTGLAVLLLFSILSGGRFACSRLSRSVESSRTGLMSSARSSQLSSSVIVVTVEGLAFDSFSCDDARINNSSGSTNASGSVEASGSVDASGFEDFCRESVRFTHAYTPSTMSQATIASLLTGLYPHQHGVRDNGGQTLKATLPTVAKKAHDSGFNTAFVSGGPPVFRRSGIYRGFQLFDDLISVSLKKLYRPASETVSTLFNWLDTQNSRTPFFAMLYWADTQFGDLPNASEVGEMRETSYASQIQVIDSSLHQLVEQLKKRRLWNSTTVIVVGLNGHESPVHADELLPMNLYSESTHVALLIKPARAKREGSFQWKIDQNVSLVDIGRTLTEMMGGTVAEESSAATVSLIPTLTNPGATWDQNRPIVSESAWTSWRGLGAIRSSLRRGPYFMIFDEKTKFFNTLTDGLEMSPLAERDDADVQNSMVNELRQMGYTSFRNFNRVFLTRASFGKDLWRSTDLDRETTTRLRDIAEHNLHDGVLQSWRALAAAHAADWKVLRAASDQMKDGSFFRYIAERQLSNDAHDGRHSRATLPDGDPCLHLLFSPIKTMKNTATERLGRCDDTLLRALAIWHDDSAAEPERSRASEEFMQAIAMSLLEVRIARQNYATGLKWDTAFEVLDSPIRAELILSLPEFKKIRTVVKQRFAELRP